MQVQTINGLRPTDVWFLANPRYSTTKQWQALIGSGLTSGDYESAKRVADCATRPWALPRILRLVRHLNDAAKCEAVDETPAATYRHKDGLIALEGRN